jgi:uncharacterized membrane protein
MDRTVRESDSWLPLIAGSALLAYGISQRSPSGTVLAVLGGSVALTGVRQLGTARADTARNGIRVEKSVTISRSVDDLYAFWRKFEQLPSVMQHLESVEQTGPNTWQWTARAPAGQTVSWEAEITAEMPGRLIGWRSLDGSTVWHEGAVEFTQATGGRGTLVKVTMRYDPPAGRIGKVIASLFREEPSQQIADDLRRFKQLMETGEISTTEGQPTGRE